MRNGLGGLNIYLWALLKTWLWVLCPLCIAIGCTPTTRAMTHCKCPRAALLTRGRPINVFVTDELDSESREGETPVPDVAYMLNGVCDEINDVLRSNYPTVSRRVTEESV